MRRRCARHADAPSVGFGAGTGKIVFNHTATNYTFAPLIGGPGTVLVEAGTTSLTANNTYTGNTTVNGGTLLVNGSIATSPTTVNAGGTLGGAGIVGNTIINGGTLSPGNSIGTLTVQGSLVLHRGLDLSDRGRSQRRRPHQRHRHRDARRRAACRAIYANGSYVGAPLHHPECDRRRQRHVQFAGQHQPAGKLLAHR